MSKPNIFTQTTKEDLNPQKVQSFYSLDNDLPVSGTWAYSPTGGLGTNNKKTPINTM
jgi:hypothetical protein